MSEFSGELVVSTYTWMEELQVFNAHFLKALLPSVCNK